MSNNTVSAVNEIDVAVIGGGQSALAVAYFLRRAGNSWQILNSWDQPPKT